MNLTHPPTAHTVSVTWLGSSLSTVSQMMILKAVLQSYNAVAMDVYDAISYILLIARTLLQLTGHSLIQFKSIQRQLKTK